MLIKVDIERGQKIWCFIHCINFLRLLSNWSNTSTGIWTWTKWSRIGIWTPKRSFRIFRRILWWHWCKEYVFLGNHLLTSSISRTHLHMNIQIHFLDQLLRKKRKSSSWKREKENYTEDQDLIKRLNNSQEKDCKD